MDNETDSLSNYIFYGMDDEGLTSNNMELMKYIYGDDDEMDLFANQTIKLDSQTKRKGLKTFSNKNEEPGRGKSKEEIKDRIIYAMRDSLKMPTLEFALLYNTTSLSAKQNVLYVLDEGVMTEFGLTDLDWAITLVAFSFGVFPSELLYPFGKPIWNILFKHKVPWDQYCNTAEVHAMMMANAMIFGHRRFYEFFPQYMDDATNPNYFSFYFKVLTEKYGKN